MNKLTLISLCITLSACSNHFDENLDMTYVKDCNKKGGRVERIEYSSALQCVGLQNKELTK